ncbi:hypothetical protein D3C78_1864230 [compost metagenome]
MPRFDKTVEVLVMVEWIAASPIDKLDIWIGTTGAIMVVFGSGIKQHVCNTGDRDVVGDWVFALRQGWPVDR